MNGLALTLEEINKLRTIHRLAKDKKGADRIKAVYLLGTGYSVEDVVKVLMLDKETLRNYVKLYQQGVLSALLKDNYKGSSAKLTAERLQELEVHLKHYT
jgi:transposase